LAIGCTHVLCILKNETKKMKLKENIYHIDILELDDIIIRIENSFGFQFEDNEIDNNLTINEWSELIISKITAEKGQECTTQIAFHKIRKALIEKFDVERNQISLKTELKEIFPIKNRIKKWKIFNELGLEGIDLQVHFSLFFTMLITIISFFFIFDSYKLYAIPLFFTMMFSSFLLMKYSNILPVKNIEELVLLIVKHNYLKMRENKGTVNYSEIKEIIFSQLTEWLGPNEKEHMNMRTKINYVD